MTSKRAVVIDGKLYDSLKSAAESNGFNMQSLYQALHRGTGEFKGHKVYYSVKTVNTLLNENKQVLTVNEDSLSDNVSTTTNRISFNGDKSALNAFRAQKMAEGRRKARLARLTNPNYQPKQRRNSEETKRVPVKCITTGKIYSSITEAAKDANVHMWTMSLKMENTGKFVDKNKNEYIRLKPMVQRTNRKYVGFGTSSIERNVVRGKNTVSETSVIDKKIELSQDEMITQSLLKSANLLATSKKYKQAANVFEILANLYDK